MARPGGSKLRSDKGMNLPDSDLRLVALTAKDIEDLEFVVRHADMISLSFINRAGGLEQLQEQLQEHLRRLHGEQLGKGPHICEVVRVLDDILRRMQAHVSKKRSMLRELELAQRFLQPNGTDR